MSYCANLLINVIRIRLYLFGNDLKKLQVQMPDQCHSMLKDYANAFGVTMSEVMYEAMRSYVQKHSLCCGYISSLFQIKGIAKDKRLSKECYGHGCFCCKHQTACRVGAYNGTWEVSDKASKYTPICVNE